jgi:fumarate hydratase subunit beta
MTYSISAPEIRKALHTLRAGDQVLLTGQIYTARDAAHKALCAGLARGEEPPFPLEDAIIYYAGPTPSKNGMAVGACGPTTASRMDGFAPALLRAGVAGMIGKGARDAGVVSAIAETGSCYFCAPGGAGALIATCITAAEEIAFPHLGCESVKRLQVKDLPLIVAIDAFGGNLFRDGPEKYRVGA